MENFAWQSTLKWAGIYTGLSGLATVLLSLFGLGPKTGGIALLIILALLYIPFYFYCIYKSYKEQEELNNGKITPLYAWLIPIIFFGINIILGLIISLFSPDSTSQISSISLLLNIENIAFGILGTILYAAIVGALVSMIFSMAWVHKKANKSGWSPYIPIYSAIVKTEIARKPGWWVAMLFIPLVNIVFAIMLINGVSKAFGKGEGFTVGLIFLPFIFYPILGFGDAKWIYGEKKEDNKDLYLEDHLVTTK